MCCFLFHQSQGIYVAYSWIISLRRGELLQLCDSYGFIHVEMEERWAKSRKLLRTCCHHDRLKFQPCKSTEAVQKHSPEGRLPLHFWDQLKPTHITTLTCHSLALAFYDTSCIPLGFLCQLDVHARGSQQRTFSYLQTTHSSYLS